MNSQSRQTIYQTAQDGVSRERYRISRGQNYDGSFYASIGAFVYAGRDYDRQLSEWVSQDGFWPSAEGRAGKTSAVRFWGRGKNSRPF